MEKLDNKTIKVSRGLTYNYYTSTAKEGQPTLFLAHGWPDTAALWSDLVADYLIPHGYGLVAIDCLGYGGTDKPTDYHAYDFQKMTADVIEILDKESIDKIVSTGHDWGCGLSQRMYNFYPNRVIGLISVSVAYFPPGPFDLDKTLEATQQALGYGNYWYWKFFTADDGAPIMNDNVDSVFDVAHGLPESWLDTFCKEDGMRDFVSKGKRQEVESYVTDDFRSQWVERLKRDKFDAPQCWYKAQTFGVQNASSAKAAENIVVKVPFLFFGGKRDMVCRPEFMKPSEDAGLLPHSKTVTVDAGHWCMFKRPKEFGEAILGWLKETF